MSDFEKRLSDSLGLTQQTANEAQETAEENQRASRRARRRRELEEVAEEVQAPSYQDSEVYKVFSDESISNKDKISKIAEMLSVDFTDSDIEDKEEALNVVKAIMKDLANQIYQVNDEQLAIIEGSPLSDLQDSYADTFRKYDDLGELRSEIESTLNTVKSMMEETSSVYAEKIKEELYEPRSGMTVSKEQALIYALQQAQREKDEKVELEEKIEAANAELTPLQTAKTKAEDAVRLAERDVSTAQTSFGWGNKQGRINDATKALEKAEKELKDAEVALEEASKEKTDAEARLEEINENFEMHEKVLDILNITNPEFIEKFKTLVQMTREVNDDTQEILEGVSNELEKSLKQTITTLNAAKSIFADLIVVQAAIEEAEDVSIEARDQFVDADVAPEGSTEVRTDFQAMFRDEVLSRGENYLKNLKRTSDNAESFRANVEQTRTTLESQRTSWEENLFDVQTDMMDHATGAGFSASTIIHAIQNLAILTQKSFAKGKNDAELEKALKTFRQQNEQMLLAIKGRNDSLGSKARQMDVLAGIRETTDSFMSELEEQRDEIVADLAEQVDRLHKVTVDSEKSAEAPSKGQEAAKKNAATASKPKQKPGA